MDRQHRDNNLKSFLFFAVSKYKKDMLVQSSTYKSRQIIQNLIDQRSIR